MGIRDRMRLVFHAEESPGGQDEQPAVPSVPMVEFVAYTDDRRLFGQIALAEGRLTDMLNATEELELVDIAVESLATGEVVETKSLVVARGDILAVHATGPRGDPGLRTSSRSHPIVVKSGPYRIEGDLHVLPTSDPFVAMRRRPPMVPLTNGVIDYEVAGEPVTRKVDTLIVNHAAMDWAVPAHDEVRMLATPLGHDAHAKDYSGELHAEADTPSEAGPAAVAAAPAAPEAPTPGMPAPGEPEVAAAATATGAAGPATAGGVAATAAETTAPTSNPVAGWAMPARDARDVQRSPSILGTGHHAPAPSAPAIPLSPAVLPGEGPVAALRRRMLEAREAARRDRD
jgi:hypothetical protein